MIRTIAIALTLATLAATGASAAETATQDRSTFTQIDSFASDGGLGTTRRGG